MYKNIILLLGVLFLVGCDDISKSTQKLPNTKGLPPSTNFYGELNLKINPEKVSTFKDAYETIKRASKRKEKGREFWREVEDVVGQLKDAGFGDIEKGDITSITFGVTIQNSLKLIEKGQAEDILPVIIIRGNFSPKRTNEFCTAEKVDSTFINGEKSWNLECLVSKISNNKIPYTASPERATWFSYADDKTLVLGLKNSLRKSLSILKGEGESLVPQPVQALKEFNDWTMYLCFTNKALVDSSIKLTESSPYRQDPASKFGVEFFKVLPHDQATLVCGSRDDNEAVAFVLSNHETNENVKYDVSTSKSLTPKFLKIYTDLIVEILNQTPGTVDSNL